MNEIKTKDNLNQADTTLIKVCLNKSLSVGIKYCMFIILAQWPIFLVEINFETLSIQYP